MSTPADFFDPWTQATLGSWTHARDEIDRLCGSYPGHRIVWRGVRDASWGVESSLYRALAGVTGATPSEADMVRAEAKLLERARSDWRFDGTSALELFAQLQHVGGPTRLLDVTENPLVALWFACQHLPLSEQTSSTLTDGRLFAFIVPPGDIELQRGWADRVPVWHRSRNDSDRRRFDWGTGLGRKYWRPPALHGRIAAQNAGFLLDGVPIAADTHGLGRVAPDLGSAEWTADEMGQFGSIPLKLTRIKDGNLPQNAAPVFNFRIAAGAKDQIDGILSSRYALRASSIYADINGLADYFARRPEELLR